jgi:hypothetical protein
MYLLQAIENPASTLACRILRTLIADSTIKKRCSGTQKWLSRPGDVALSELFGCLPQLYISLMTRLDMGLETLFHLPSTTEHDRYPSKCLFDQHGCNVSDTIHTHIYRSVFSCCIVAVIDAV